MIIFSAPSRAQQVLTPLGSEQTTSLLVVLVDTDYPYPMVYPRFCYQKSISEQLSISTNCVNNGGYIPTNYFISSIFYNLGCPLSRPRLNSNNFFTHFLSKLNFNVNPFAVCSINPSQNQNTTCVLHLIFNCSS